MFPYYNGDHIEINIYGFKAKVLKDGKYYVATVRELHANTQAKSLKELRANLKEVVSLVFEDVLMHETHYSKAIAKKVKENIIQNLA